MNTSNGKSVEHLFKKWILSDEQIEQYKNEKSSLEGRLNSFRAGYSARDKEVADLREALNWALAASRFYIKHWFTDSGLESMRERDAKRVDGYRIKFNLDNNDTKDKG